MMLSDFFEKAYIMAKTETPDGYGGTVETWTDGTEIAAGFARDNSAEARIAERDGVKVVWTIVHPLDVNLAQNDRVKRDKTGDVFRITSNSRDMETPAISEMKFRQASAEVITL